MSALHFNKGTDDFFVDLDGTRETHHFALKPLDASTRCQVVTLNTLRKNFASQTFLFRHFPCITASMIAGNHSNIESGQKRQ